MSNFPKISVIMSVYNNAEFLKESVDSILAQTFADFEFLITDDCSTDNSLSILEEYEKKDKRIKLNKNTENIGLTANLNRMIEISQGKYIARMDSDDISLSDRFEVQYEHMENNPRTGVLGTYSKIFGKNIKSKIFKRPLKHEEIKIALLFENIMVHSTIFIRSSVLRSLNIRYDEDFRIIQDYDLWSRLIDVAGFEILPEAKIFYRMTDSNLCAVSSKKKNYREDILKRIYRSQFLKNGFEFNEDQIEAQIYIGYKRTNDLLSILNESELWLENLKNQNYSLGSFDRTAFDKYISKYWFSICTKSSSLGLQVLLKYFKSPLRKYFNPGFILKTKFYVKCLLRF